MGKIELAYIADLFDGDGCVYIHKLKPNLKHRMVNPEYRIAVAIANIYEPILRELQETFGGSVKRKGVPEKASHTQAFQWGTESRMAVSFLIKIIPYLRIKREQAQLALLFQLEKDSIILRKRRPYSQAEIGDFEWYKQRISELKGNGSKS